MRAARGAAIAIAVLAGCTSGPANHVAPTSTAPTRTAPSATTAPLADDKLTVAEQRTVDGTSVWFDPAPADVEPALTRAQAIAVVAATWGPTFASQPGLRAAFGVLRPGAASETAARELASFIHPVDSTAGPVLPVWAVSVGDVTGTARRTVGGPGYVGPPPNLLVVVDDRAGTELVYWVYAT